MSARRGPERAAAGHRRAALRPPLWRELALGLAVFAVYASVAQRSAAGRAPTARSHALDVVRLERALHVDLEPALNAWLVPHAALRVAADYEYATTYVLSAFGLLFWVWARRPEVYRWARTSFVLLNLSATACFALWPLMPPRLLGSGGGERFVDTVLLGRTWGSWGSPVGDHANQFAAMPSLHFAWAVWVSVVLAHLAAGWRTQLVSAVHVLVTAWVIMATANHYLLDALAGVVLAEVCVSVAGLAGRSAAGPDVAPADAFFLHVDAAAPQVVGGVAVPAGPGERPTRAQVAAAVAAALPDQPALLRAVEPGRPWRRPRWVDVPARAIDLGAHVPEVAAGGRSVEEVVGELMTQRIPTTSPPWRVVVVTDGAPGAGRAAAVVVLAHHALLDGLGAIAAATALVGAPGSVRLPVPARPGALRAAVCAAGGVLQLAADGRDEAPWPVAGRTGAGAVRRAVALVELDGHLARGVARRQGATLRDVVAATLAGALSRTCGAAAPPHLRTAVSLALPRPVGAAGGGGNAVSAVFVDLPLAAPDAATRLRQVVEGSHRLRTGRGPGSRAAQHLAGLLLPPVLHARFARAVYGRRSCSAALALLPGPARPVLVAGTTPAGVWPLVPLVPGTPLAVGAMGAGAALRVGLVGDPELLDVTAVAAALPAALAELASAPGGGAHAGAPHPSASSRRARAAGSSRSSPNAARSWSRR